jgi:hypothetical protein
MHPSLKRRLRIIKSLGSFKPYLYILEQFILLVPFRLNKPQLFILGLPRSGTTLVYQYIAHRLEVAYFTHGVGQFPRSPCTVTFLQKKVYGTYVSNFKSSYGKVSGPVSPREAGTFWARFFDLEAYSSFQDIASQDIFYLRNTVGCIQSIYGNAPFVNKNVKHMLRIEPLSKIFPDSYFLVVERDMKDVALSVLRARYANNAGDATKWWSVRPPDYQHIKDLPPPEQVVCQLTSLEQQMNNDLACLPAERVIRIPYEQFCDAPETLIHTLQHVLGALEYRNPAEPCFQKSRRKTQTREEEHLIHLCDTISQEKVPQALQDKEDLCR